MLVECEFLVEKEIKKDRAREEKKKKNSDKNKTERKWKITEKIYLLVTFLLFIWIYVRRKKWWIFFIFSYFISRVEIFLINTYIFSSYCFCFFTITSYHIFSNEIFYDGEKYVYENEKNNWKDFLCLFVMEIRYNLNLHHSSSFLSLLLKI